MQHCVYCYYCSVTYRGYYWIVVMVATIIQCYPVSSICTRLYSYWIESFSLLFSIWWSFWECVWWWKWSGFLSTKNPSFQWLLCKCDKLLRIHSICSTRWYSSMTYYEPLVTLFIVSSNITGTHIFNDRCCSIIID